VPKADDASAAFIELDWRRIDVWAIVAWSGVTTIELRRLESCRNWLRNHGYETAAFDCSSGLKNAIPELGRLLNWQQQFGYSLDPEKRNLDALRDGFAFDIPAAGGQVLEITRPDVAWREDSRWLLGLLSIAQEYSRNQLALGRRFFTLLALPEDSRLIGQTIETTAVPSPFTNPCREIREFQR